MSLVVYFLFWLRFYVVLLVKPFIDCLPLVSIWYWFCVACAFICFVVLSELFVCVINMLVLPFLLLFVLWLYSASLDCNSIISLLFLDMILLTII